MKIQVIGSDIFGDIIQGSIKIGSKIVLRHRGKVKHGVIIRTKNFNNFFVSYDKPAVMIINETNRVKGPISKGLKEELRALSNIQI